MNKYYTPSIEDIHIGYEFHLNLDGKIDNSVSTLLRFDDTKTKWVLTEEWVEAHVKTAYLTKEQIEGEGWSNPEVYRDGGTLLYKQEGYELTFKGENNLARSRQIKVEKVWKTMEGKRLSLCLFLGECPSINEFRKICKLLNI